MKLKFLLAVTLIICSISALRAQEDSISNKGILTISGYVDSYYQYNLNRPLSGYNQGRIFDLPHNSFNLGLVQTVFSYSINKLNVVADLTFGPNADLGNFGNQGTSRLIKQAYISYDFTDNVTFTIGQFGTHIGYELIDAPLNFNYSLSYLFGNGPFYHTGAKLDFALSDKVGLMVGVVNGWDAIQDYNEKKSLVAQVSFAPVEGFDIYVNWIGGDEYDFRELPGEMGNSAFGANKDSYTSLFDLTTSYQVTPSFLLGLNAAYGSFKTGAAVADDSDDWSKDATWSGAAIYSNYAFNDMFALGVRGEYFSDPSGVRYFGPVEVTALTLTGDVKLADGRFSIKPELRFDSAKDAFFEDSKGLGTKTQTTLGAAFIYAF
ncbi:MAG: porin [Bacteroidota bacterium]|nr:porin [Bacteroidota bacterium]